MLPAEISYPIFRSTFGKQERLTSKKEIELIFKSGKSLFSFPFKVYFLFGNEEAKVEAKVLITVSKRQFKKAVDRNKVKRLFRECYRKNKNKLDLSTSNKPIHIAFLYVHSEIISYVEMEKKSILIFEKINKHIDRK